MTHPPGQPTLEEAATLRHQAEAQLAREPGPLAQTVQAATSGAEAQRLIHELQVYQVELELQNQTLLETRRQLEQSLESYTNLYDFAPAVYFTLTDQGTIQEVNLADAALFGQPRAKLLDRPFDRWVAANNRQVFRAFLNQVSQGLGKESCENELPAWPPLRCASHGTPLTGQQVQSFGVI